MNQYTARTNHGYLLVEGTSSNAAVKVYETGSTEETAARKNDYYFRDWDPNTSSTASDYPQINVKEGTSVSATKNAWIPAASETPITYDANGNLTADALWIYTYDEDGARQRVDGAPQRGVPGAKRRVRKAGALWATDEQNRLISMAETAAAATAGFPDTAITFKYDYLGRRVEKKVVRGTTTESHLRFVWRGWLLARISPKSSTALRNVGTGPGIVRCAELQGVDPASSAPPLETHSSTRPPFARYEFCEISGPVAELNAASDNAVVKTYTWGPDVSGSLGGAGGNGGVLIFKDHTSTVNESFYPAYDARGNVTGLIDTAGNLDAAYEYDPFGKLIRYAGARSASMSLLYGTKYTDMESGLIYFGHRYYDPRQGRFINRDPIEEEGGINLYGFVGNNPVNRLDFLGLCDGEGTTDEHGNEICYLELEQFTVVEEITAADQAYYDFQDQMTESQIEELNAWDLNRQNNVDTGSGGPVKKVEKKEEEEDEDDEKTDCEELVEELVDLAEHAPPWWRYANARVSTGYGMMSASWYDQRFWNGTPHHPVLGPGRLGGGNGTRINYPVTGFRPELVDHGQNSDVMKHILGHAGAHVAGTGLSLTVAYFQNADDQGWADSGRLQSEVELLNNQVGKEVGRSMVATFNGRQSKADLLKHLLELLCESEN